jgi:hypothetical protein
MAAYADWLATSGVPKLFVKAEPGAILAGGIGRAIAGWILKLSLALRPYFEAELGCRLMAQLCRVGRQSKSAAIWGTPVVALT